MINQCIANYNRQAADAESKILRYDKALAALGVAEVAGEYAGDTALVLSRLEVFSAGGAVVLRAMGKPVAKRVVQAAAKQVVAKSESFAMEIAKDKAEKYDAEVAKVGAVKAYEAVTSCQ